MSGAMWLGVGVGTIVGVALLAAWAVGGIRGEPQQSTRRDMLSDGDRINHDHLGDPPTHDG